MGDLSIKTHSNTFATLLHITHRGYYNDTVKEEKESMSNDTPPHTPHSLELLIMISTCGPQWLLGDFLILRISQDSAF